MEKTAIAYSNMLKKVFRNRNSKIRFLQFFNHLMLIPAFYNLSYSWALISIFCYFLFFGIGIDIGMHRLFSHASFKVSGLTKIILLVFASLATIGSSIAWVGMHRKHHANSDKGNDPHTPHRADSKFGTIFAYFGLWNKYHASPKFSRVVRSDSHHMFFHYYYFLIIGVYVIVLSALSFKLALFAYFVPACLCFHAASLIVTLGHGSHQLNQDTRDYSKNSLVLHWVTFGEGLHKNHHKFPNQYFIKNQPWYFFDLPGFLIENFFKQQTKY